MGLRSRVPLLSAAGHHHPPRRGSLRATGPLALGIRRGGFLGLFVTDGFLISPTGISNLTGEAGTNVAIGQGIQVMGVVTVLIAGVIATRSNYTHPPTSRT